MRVESVVVLSPRQMLNAKCQANAAAFLTARSPDQLIAGLSNPRTGIPALHHSIIRSFIHPSLEEPVSQSVYVQGQPRQSSCNRLSPFLRLRSAAQPRRDETWHAQSQHMIFALSPAHHCCVSNSFAGLFSLPSCWLSCLHTSLLEAKHCVDFVF